MVLNNNLNQVEGSDKSALAGPSSLSSNLWVAVTLACLPVLVASVGWAWLAKKKKMMKQAASSSSSSSSSAKVESASTSSMATKTMTTFSIPWKNNNKKKRRDEYISQRSLSFTSRAMVGGGFPARCQSPEPIIHATVLVNQLPAVEDLVTQVLRPLLQYDRLRGIPDQKVAGIRYPHIPTRTENEASSSSSSSTTTTTFFSTVVDPHDLIRCIDVHGEDETCCVQAIQDMLHQPLTKDRGDLPWWEMVLINNHGAGPSACVLRIHHALADGISLMTLFEQVAVYADTGRPLDSLVAAFMAKKSISSALDQPARSRYSVASILSAIYTVLTLGQTKFDDPILFNCGHRNMVHSNQRRLVVLPTVPLAWIKQLKNAGQVTVNDILMTAVSQAIRDYCLEQKCPVFLQKTAANQPIQCRAFIPVVLPRSLSEKQDPLKQTLRNKFTFVSIDLGVHLPDVMDRLRYIHDKTLAVKSSPLTAVAMMFQNKLMPLLPAWLSRQLTLDMFSRQTVVFSNVPGPERKCRVAGSVVQGVEMFFSQLIQQVGLISYDDQVFGSMTLDTDRLPQPDRVAAAYGQALLDLSQRLGVEPPSEVVVLLSSSSVAVSVAPPVVDPVAPLP